MVGEIATPSLTPYSASTHLLTAMNTSTMPPVNRTALCYSHNTSSLKNSPTISPLHSAIFTSLGLLFNLVAFYVLVKSYQRTQSKSRSSFLIFLGGLVVTDFMGLLTTGSIVVSFHITNFNWQVVDPNCHLCNFMGMSMVFYGLCPLLLGATMAGERFIGINRPFTRYTSLPKNRTVSMLLLVWLIAGSVALLPLVGVGCYHLQLPGSWCFFSIDSKGNDQAFSLIFSLFGLLCIAMSFLLNTVSVVTLIKMCCSRDKTRRRRDHELEMMVQLILINIVASICWCPLLIFIAKTVLSGGQLNVKYLLLWIRFVTCNQLLDPWIYILFRRAVIQRLFPRWSWGSVMSRYPSFSDTIRRLTLSSPKGSQGQVDKEDSEVEQIG